MKYVPGASNSNASAVETAQTKSGVCRDYARLGIALTRSLSIPARMVVGYLYRLEPMDLHAWFEAFVGGRWFTFDGMQKEPCGNRITIGYGRDAADVALTSNYGPLLLNTLQVTVEKAGVEREDSHDMSSLRIIHETICSYQKAVRFGPHRLVLRPREGHDVRVEEMRLEIAPEFELEWSRAWIGRRLKWTMQMSRGPSDFVREPRNSSAHQR